MRTWSAIAAVPSLAFAALALAACSNGPAGPQAAQKEQVAEARQAVVAPRDVCADNPGVCKHGGTCSNIYPPPVGGRPISCTCPTGWTGWDCSISACPCSQADPAWDPALAQPGFPIKPSWLKAFQTLCTGMGGITLDTNTTKGRVTELQKGPAGLAGFVDAFIFFNLVTAPGATISSYCAAEQTAIFRFSQTMTAQLSDPNGTGMCMDPANAILVQMTPAEGAACSAQIAAAPLATSNSCWGSPNTGTLPDVPYGVALGAPALLGLAGLLRRRSRKGGAKGGRRRSWILPIIGGALFLGGCQQRATDDQGAVGQAQLACDDGTYHTCVTLQRGKAGAVVADAMLSNPPVDQNYGSGPILRVGGKDESVLRFDLASIPAGAVIESAALKLYVNGSAGDLPINVHAANADWDEANVTTSSFAQHFDPAVTGVLQTYSTNAQKSVDLTTLVTGWFTGARANQGVVLETSDTKKTIFVSSEGTAARRPALEVCYQEPEINHCDPNPCAHGSCDNNHYGYLCACEAGWMGANCNININECAPKPCQHGGTCTDLVNGFSCACAPGWAGDYCELQIDNCTPDPCNGNGWCSNGVNKYTCHCGAGWKGTHCDVHSNCSSYPCAHGTCTNKSGSYVCACPAGWTGKDCDVNIDDCVGNACENGATCVDELNGYTCACLPGFTGAHCETNIDECASSACLNGGTCVDGVNSYTCACAPGYTGANCEIDIDECASAPCVNGQCVDLINGYTCTCPEGWAGTNCEVPSDPCVWGPCQNGGTCTALDSAYYACSCAGGFTGFECEVAPDPCAGDPCNAHGLCIPQGTSFTCQCIPGWRGGSPTCDVPSCPCADADPNFLSYVNTPGRLVIPTGLQTYLSVCVGGTADVSGMQMWIAGLDDTSLAAVQATLAALETTDPATYCPAAFEIWLNLLHSDTLLGSTVTGSQGAVLFGTYSGSLMEYTGSGALCLTPLSAQPLDATQQALCQGQLDTFTGGSTPTQL